MFFHGGGCWPFTHGWTGKVKAESDDVDIVACAQRACHTLSFPCRGWDLLGLASRACLHSAPGISFQLLSDISSSSLQPRWLYIQMNICFFFFFFLKLHFTHILHSLENLFLNSTGRSQRTGITCFVDQATGHAFYFGIVNIFLHEGRICLAGF